MSLTLHIHTGADFDPEVKFYPGCDTGPFASILLDRTSGAALFVIDPEHADKLIRAAQEVKAQLEAAQQQASERQS